MPIGFGGQGVPPSGRGLICNALALPAGAVWQPTTAGAFAAKPGRYTSLQIFDPVMQAWRNIGGGPVDATMSFVNIDGINWRFANQTGCAVGALLTTAGSGYTSAPTVTASAGNSIWRAIVGGAISTTITISNGGSNYTYPPQVLLSAPPAGGIQATAICTLSGGVVNAITVIDQGAGYTSPPTVTFVNDYRETQSLTSNGNITQGSNASAVCTLTGANTITGVICVDHGTPLTSVPTLSFSGGGGSSAAATAIMCWSITAYTAGTAGAGLAGTVARITGEDAFPTTSPAYTNVTTQSNLVKTRSADIKAPISGAGITATGQVIYDGGIYTSTPTPLVIPTASIVSTAPIVTFTMGGLSDVSELLTL
jgi:hypothetical protein